MKLLVDAELPLEAMFEQDILAGERAVTRVMQRAATLLKDTWRADITRAGLGPKLARTVRAETYPKGGASLNAAGLVWTKAPEIIGAHDTGALIRSKDGFYLAVPLPAAGRSQRGGRITPGEWERRHGQRLRFVYRRNRPSLLVADDARLTKRSGMAAPKRGRRRKDGVLTGAQTVPIFVLLPQVKLRKRMDLMRSADRLHDQLPAMISAEWKD